MEWFEKYLNTLFISTTDANRGSVGQATGRGEIKEGGERADQAGAGLGRREEWRTGEGQRRERKNIEEQDTNAGAKII